MVMKRTLLSALLLGIGANLFAADFFSTEKPEDFCNFGVRLGINTSNRTVGTQMMNGFTMTSPNSNYGRQGWGTGFDLGVVADLNIRDYLSIQPGLFYESRSNSYTFISSQAVTPDYNILFNQAGIYNSYQFTIPVLASFHFNITDDLRWVVEAGPYISFVMHSKLKNKVLTNSAIISGNPLGYDPEILYGLAGGAVTGEFTQKAKTGEFGFKFGTGFTILKKYTCGIHYMAATTHAWKDEKVDNAYKLTYGGHAKSWVFTIGYNF